MLLYFKQRSILARTLLLAVCTIGSILRLSNGQIAGNGPVPDLSGLLGKTDISQG